MIPVEPDDHVARLQDRLSEAPPSDPVERATLEFTLGLALAEHPRADPVMLRRAIGHLSTALKVFDRHRFPVPRARALTVLGTVERRLGMSVVAIDRFRQAAAVLDEVEAPSELGAALNNLALTLAEAGRSTEAITAYHEALSHLDGSLPRQRAAAMVNLGLCLSEQGEMERAVAVLSEAVDLTSPEVDGPVWATACHELGVALIGLERWDEAIAWLARAETVFTRRTYPVRHAMARYNRGLALAGSGDPDAASARAALAAFEDALTLLDVNEHAQPRAEATVSMNAALDHLDGLGLGRDRPSHFARHLVELDPGGRLEALRYRLHRVLDTPEPGRTAQLEALDRALCRLDEPGMTAVARDWMRVLTEDRFDAAASALVVRLGVLGELEGEARYAAWMALESAIGDLEILIRMQVRGILEANGYGRPDSR